MPGDVTVGGDIKLIGADCAENFDVAEPESVEPGAVMVIDDCSTLKQCEQEYDKRVAGVISGAGQFQSGLILDTREPQSNRMPLALAGKVCCKVDAERAPVETGDLLTTSATPGHAMKAADPKQSFGAVIGKAMQPLRVGQDLVPLLVSLQ